jgi:hypothetical protein
LVVATVPIASAQWIAENPALDFEKLPNGLLIHMQSGAFRLKSAQNPCWNDPLKLMQLVRNSNGAQFTPAGVLNWP